MQANLNQIVQVFSAIRDARTAKKRAWEEEDATLEADMHKLKVFMLEMLNATGAKSIATDHGTVFRTEKVKPSAADWTSVYEWIAQDPERFDVRRRASDHLGFGNGTHMCAGLHLARLEMTALLEVLVEKVARFDIGEPVLALNNVLRGLASLPVRVA